MEEDANKLTIVQRTKWRVVETEFASTGGSNECPIRYLNNIDFNANDVNFVEYKSIFSGRIDRIKSEFQGV